jgi:hypothetical protein
MQVKYRTALLALATMSGASMIAGNASASGAKETVHVYDVNGGTSNTGSIVITGAIGDSGTDQSGFTPTANRIVLSKGSFEIDTSAIQKKFNAAKPIQNPDNCGVVLAATAPATVFNGTGAYKGISGKVTLHISSAAVLPTKSNGKCDESPNATAIGEVTISQGSGTISFK